VLSSEPGSRPGFAGRIKGSFRNVQYVPEEKTPPAAEEALNELKPAE
jgi:hypothetical protein